MIVFFSGPLQPDGWLLKVTKQRSCTDPEEIVPYPKPVLGVSVDGECSVYTEFQLTAQEYHVFLLSCVEYFAKKARLTV